MREGDTGAPGATACAGPVGPVGPAGIVVSTGVITRHVEGDTRYRDPGCGILEGAQGLPRSFRSHEYPQVQLRFTRRDHLASCGQDELGVTRVPHQRNPQRRHGQRSGAEVEATPDCDPHHARRGLLAEFLPRTEREQEDAWRTQAAERGQQDGLPGAIGEPTRAERLGYEPAESPVDATRGPSKRTVLGKEPDCRDVRGTTLYGSRVDPDFDGCTHCADSLAARATASMMPLTNAGDRSLPKRRASSTASLMITAGGVSVCASS